MTPTETATILRQFNAWRRDFDDKFEQPDTREISEAIDAAAEMIDHLEAAEKERDALRANLDDHRALVSVLREEVTKLRARIEEMNGQEPPCGWWDDLIADISAIDCMYRGSPTYAHDAYWMRDRVVWMLKQRRDSAPGTKGEEK